MKRLSDKKFIEMKPDMDKVVAIRIKNGDFYFIDKKYDNAYQRFLSFVKCYERNGVASENDHDILLISEDEISNFSDLLRDGDYVWIVESVDA